MMITDLPGDVEELDDTGDLENPGDRGDVQDLACGLHVNSFFLHEEHVNSLTCSREPPSQFERLVLGCIDADFCK